MCQCGNMRAERTRNKSQHTNLTLEKKILPLLVSGFELTNFRSPVRRSNNKLFRMIPDITHAVIKNKLNNNNNNKVFLSM